MIIMDKNENEKQFIDKKRKQRRERKEEREEQIKRNKGEKKWRERQTDVGEMEKSRTLHRNRLMH